MVGRPHSNSMADMVAATVARLLSSSMEDTDLLRRNSMAGTVVDMAGRLRSSSMVDMGEDMAGRRLSRVCLFSCAMGCEADAWCE